jgi:hypothetical protein
MEVKFYAIEFPKLMDNEKLIQGNKEVLKKCKVLYPKIISYIELRKGSNREEKYRI